MDLAALGISNIGIVIIFMSVVMTALPSSPFETYKNLSANLPQLSYLNWFLPVGEMIAVLQVWLAAVTAFYIISLLARWIKLIE